MGSGEGRRRPGSLRGVARGPVQSGRSGFGHAALEGAKWIALAAMTVDHYGKIVAPDLLAVTHLVGRLAFPLFAGIVGTRLALSPDLAPRYLRSLAPWAVVSQPVFVLAGRSWSEGNILVTLALGVTAWWAIRQVAERAWLRGALLVGATAVLAPFTEYGAAGVAMVPAVAWLGARDPMRCLWLIGPLGVAANLVPGWPPLEATDLFALLSTPVVLATLSAGPKLPRLPKHVFYAYYPAHLLTLHLTDLYL